MKTYAKVFSVLTVIMSVIVLCMITYPKIDEMLEDSKLDMYNMAQANIIEGATDKYNDNKSTDEITVYSVSDLIKEGYMSKDEKNPATGKKYKKDDKVLVVNDGKKLKIYYMNGDLLRDVIKDKTDKDGLYYENGEYIYKGENTLNYISFNGEIYRIIKVDSEGSAYLIKNDCDKKVKKDGILDYLNTIYNDNYESNIKDLIKEKNTLLSYDLYINSFLENKTFIMAKDYMWLSKDNDSAVLDPVNNEFVNENKACAVNIIKLNSGIIISQGTGSQVNPYIINM